MQTGVFYDRNTLIFLGTFYLQKTVYRPTGWAHRVNCVSLIMPARKRHCVQTRALAFMTHSPQCEFYRWLHWHHQLLYITFVLFSRTGTKTAKTINENCTTRTKAILRRKLQSMNWKRMKKCCCIRHKKLSTVADLMCTILRTLFNIKLV